VFYSSLQFDINKIKSSSGKLMPEKLLEFNKLEMANLLQDEKNHTFFIERIVTLDYMLTLFILYYLLC